MKPFKTINLGKEILFLRLLQNKRVGLITKDGGYRVLLQDDGSMSDGFKLSKVMFEDKYPVSIISPMYGYAVCADKAVNALITIDFDAKKPLHRCPIPLEKISAVDIDKSERYLSTGGIDGKVFLWDLESGEFIQKGAFKEAKELVLYQNDTEAAKNVLKGFYSVQAKAPLITALIRNRELFVQMKSLIKQRDFKGFFSLVMKYKFLKDTSEYKMVMGYGDMLLRSVKERLKDRQYKGILEDIKKLLEFKHLENEAKEIYEFAKCASEFLEHYRKKEYFECYRMIDENSSLIGFDEAKSLEERWQKVICEASMYATKGDMKSTKESLSKFMELESRRPKIGSILRLCSYTQLRNGCKTPPFDVKKIERGVIRFIVIFGYDDDIEHLLEHLKKEYGVDIMLDRAHKEHRVCDWYEVTKGNLPDDIFS